MRLALQALFCKGQDSSEEDLRRRAIIENELRNNARSAEFFRKIRQVVSAPLRKAPEVFADESFPDANIVAEYLDCQLESTEISDEYERVCCESPEILAEVGDCYDVLNNRLPQPLTAPKNCRRRLYYVAWEEEPPRSSTKEKKANEPSGEEHVYDAEYLTSRSRGPSIDVEVNRDKGTKPRTGASDRRTLRENEVQLKINSQKPARRVLGLGIKGCLGLIIVAGCVNGFAKWRDIERSQTLDVRPGIVQSPGVVENEEDARREESVEDVAPDDDCIVVNSELSSTGVENDSLGPEPEPEPVKVARLPEDVAPVTVVPEQEDQGFTRSRRGLGTASGGKRGEIEIPDQNNNAFSNVQVQGY